MNQLTLIGHDEDAVCGRCLESTSAEFLTPVVGLETGDEWWCEDCMTDVEPVPVECAVCTQRFDSNEQHELIEARWIKGFYEDGADAFFCSYCASENDWLFTKS